MPIDQKIFCFFILLLEIIVNMNTKYYKSGILITRHKLIISNYMRKGFLSDLLCLITLFTSPVLRLVFIIKFASIGEIIQRIKLDFIQKSIYQAIIQLAIVFYRVIMLAHFLACIWYALGIYQYRK
jgi:hypothetical protein